MSCQIRKATRADVPGLRRLWQLGFPGDETACDFFFARLYPDAYSLVAADSSDRPVSMLHMLPYTFWWRGRAWDLFYIYGVATHPEHQNKGLAGRLLDQAFFTAHLRAVPLVSLIVQTPGLVDYYARFGFIPCTPKPIFTLSASRWLRAQEEDIPRLNILYETHLKAVAHPMRNERQWQDILSELSPWGGQPFFLGGDGYALMTPSGDRIWEAFGDGSACRYTDQPMACLRVVEVEPLLAHAKDTGLPIPPFSLTDDYAPWNNRTDPGAGSDATWCAAQLAQALFLQEATPYLHLMHN